MPTPPFPVGCCGFPKRRAVYYQHLPAVEVQQTFYRPPRLETAQRWRHEAPPDFVFTLKAWQLITHPPSSPTYRKANLRVDDPQAYGFFRPTRQVFEAWERTRAIAQALRAEAVLFQSPPSFRPTDENIANMQRFFSHIERGPFLLAWEPRGEWTREQAVALCQALDLALALDPFEQEPPEGVPRYYRMHGQALGRGRYRYHYRYSDDELDRLVALTQARPPRFLFFNNSAMWEDARRFLARWAAATASTKAGAA
ncbi:MAG: DUF72 domain-containing protein [Chloroflexi bacterium]|nr:DUF72 domain-containing protein [Chloroflexota bacterium]